MSFYSHSETSLAMSTLAIWCRVVQSRDVRSRVFSRPPACHYDTTKSWRDGPSGIGVYIYIYIYIAVWWSLLVTLGQTQGRGLRPSRRQRSTLTVEGVSQLTTTPLYVGDSYSVGVSVHTAAVILWDKVALSAYSESASW